MNRPLPQTRDAAVRRRLVSWRSAVAIGFLGWVLAGHLLFRPWRTGLASTIAVASSTLGPSYPPYGVIDGHLDAKEWGAGAGWSSLDPPTEAHPQELVLIFHEPRTIGSVELHGYPDPKVSLRSFVFQREWKGEWVDIPETRVVDGGGATNWKFEFQPVETPRLRLFMTGSMGDTARIMELVLGPSH